MYSLAWSPVGSSGGSWASYRYTSPASSMALCYSLCVIDMAGLLAGSYTACVFSSGTDADGAGSCGLLSTTAQPTGGDVPVFPTTGTSMVPISKPTTFKLVGQVDLTSPATCKVNLLVQQSSSVCAAGTDFYCDGITLTVTNGCRGVFQCNGKKVKCGSVDYGATSCSCAYEPNAINSFFLPEPLQVWAY
jgi:hypothetical protein